MRFTEVREDLLMSVSDLLDALVLDLDHLYVEPDCGTTLDYKFDIAAEEFIEFAEKDIVAGGRQGLVNALSNAKRAIDCQVDKVLGCFGLLSRRNFPQKMEILQNMGIVAPRIVRKVVNARNYLEHEYRIPEQEQVEDAVDIATLFVISLDRAMHYFPEHYEIGMVPVSGEPRHDYPHMDKWISVGFDTDARRYLLTGKAVRDPSNPDEKRWDDVGQAMVTPNDKGYLELIRVSFCVEKNRHAKSAARSFLTLFVQT